MIEPSWMDDLRVVRGPRTGGPSKYAQRFPTLCMEASQPTANGFARSGGKKARRRARIRAWRETARPLVADQRCAEATQHPANRTRNRGGAAARKRQAHSPRIGRDVLHHQG